jgi:hypothetical protein
MLFLSLKAAGKGSYEGSWGVRIEHAAGIACWNCFSGMSTNLDERKFVGAIGWGSLEVGERVKKEKDVFTARMQFLGLELACSFLAKFETS